MCSWFIENKLIYDRGTKMFLKVLLFFHKSKNKSKVKVMIIIIVFGM